MARQTLRSVVLFLTLPVVSGGPAHPDAQVSVDAGRVRIDARSEPLAEILSRFARATGAEIVYEAARPRQLVSVRIEAETMGEALIQLLEGQGINYALRLDPTGRKVEMLVVAGSATAAAASSNSDRSRRSRLAQEPAAPDETEPFPEPAFPADAGEGTPFPEPSGDAAESLGPGVVPPGMGAPELVPGLPPEAPTSTTDDPLVVPGQPQLPSPASYPGIPPPSRPAFPGPASYPGTSWD